MILDFHTHFYTEAYLNALERGDCAAQIERTADGQRRIAFAGDYSLVLPEHFQIERVAAAMAGHGIDHQLLGFSVPGLHIEEATRAIDLAQTINDAYAAIVAAQPTRFSALAALPLQAPAAAALELERAVHQGLVGGQLFSNINGQSLADPAFWPVYETAERLDVPLFIHPISPVNITGMAQHRLVPMAGFMFDTTIAALQLVFGGVMSHFPGLKIVLGNLGGTLPFLAGRVEQAYHAYPETRAALDAPPSTYLRRFYLETAGMPDAGALQLAIQFAGADHILLGTDFPQQIADVAGALRQIDDLPLSTAIKNGLKGENAARLLKIGG
ncbi:MAG: amidohydrolase [Ardenticatenales bacterium]|nr:amidohydrolase [Ardenticatenales bacterium]